MGRSVNLDIRHYRIAATIAYSLLRRPNWLETGKVESGKAKVENAEVGRLRQATACQGGQTRRRGWMIANGESLSSRYGWIAAQRIIPSTRMGGPRSRVACPGANSDR